MGATAFLFQHCGSLKIALNGSAIIIKANNSTKYAIFRLLNCASFSIFNGTLRVDADVHDYAVATYGGKREDSTHEWGHGIIVNGSRGVIENLCILNMTGDGIKTGSFRSKEGTYHAKVTIRDVEIFNCRRNGIACLSSRIELIFKYGEAAHDYTERELSWSHSAELLFNFINAL